MLIGGENWECLNLPSPWISYIKMGQGVNETDLVQFMYAMHRPTPVPHPAKIPGTSCTALLQFHIQQRYQVCHALPYSSSTSSEDYRYTHSVFQESYCESHYLSLAESSQNGGPISSILPTEKWRKKVTPPTDLIKNQYGNDLDGVITWQILQLIASNSKRQMVS